MSHRDGKAEREGHQVKRNKLPPSEATTFRKLKSCLFSALAWAHPDVDSVLGNKHEAGSSGR